MRGVEANPAQPMQQPKHGQMHQYANRPHGSEGQEAQRQHATQSLIRQQAREFQQHRRIQLAFAGNTRAEGIGDLQAAQRPLR